MGAASPALNKQTTTTKQVRFCIFSSFIQVVFAVFFSLLAARPNSTKIGEVVAPGEPDSSARPDFTFFANLLFALNFLQIYYLLRIHVQFLSNRETQRAEVLHLSRARAELQPFQFLLNSA